MPLRWDSYSDQPDIIRDRAYKKRIYKQVVWDFIKMLMTNGIVFPIAFVYYLIVPARKLDIDAKQLFGIGINRDKNPQHTRALVDDLGVETLLIRMPLHDIERIADYVAFAEGYVDKDLVINVLQDRRHVEDLARLKQSLTQVFEQFSPLTHRFQIGNAINRKKWAIFSMDEYLQVYRVAYSLKQQRFPDLVLLGSSVIDFEYYFTIRTVFNAVRIRFDQFSSLLYVDRRGAPENTQMGMGVINKLHLLQSILRLSRAVSTKFSKGNTPDIVITETNWPIENTKPYAPTSGTECVNLEDHANYLVRYYLLVWASGVVRNVYWHQLIAPGYGLIDNREDELVKYPSYHAYKTMVKYLQGCRFIELKHRGYLYRALFENVSGQQNIEVVWLHPRSDKPVMVDIKGRTIIARDGEVKQSETLGWIVTESPTYLIRDLNTIAAEA